MMPHAIAALAVGGNGSAMRQPSQRGERLGQDFMRGNIAQCGDKSDSTGVVIEARIHERGGTTLLQRL